MKMIQSLITKKVLMIALLALAFNGCKKTDVSNVKSITINLSEIQMEVGGDTKTLEVVITPSDAEDKTILWASENSSVAEVDVNGVVTALKPGTTKIIATSNDGGKTAECKVTVSGEDDGNGGSEESIAFNPISANLEVEGSTEVTVVVSPLEAEIVWANSKDDGFAKIYSAADGTTVIADFTIIGGSSPKIRIQGIAVGLGSISATIKDTGIKASLKVTVVEPKERKPATDVQLDFDVFEVVVGGTKVLEAFLIPSDADYSSIKWSQGTNGNTRDILSKDGNDIIATYKIDPTDRRKIIIQGEKVGKGRIFVFVDTDISDYKAISVVEAVQVSSVNTTPGSELELVLNNSSEVTARVLPTDVLDKRVTWSKGVNGGNNIVNNTNSIIATYTIDSDDGNKITVTGVATGTGNLIVRTESGGKESSLLVKVVNENDQVKVTKIQLDKSIMTINIDEEDETNLQIKILKIEPQGSSNQKVNWKSSDESIVTFEITDDQEHIIKVNPEGAGVATIFVTSDSDDDVTASCQITVIGVQSVTIGEKKDDAQTAVVTGITEGIFLNILEETGKEIPDDLEGITKLVTELFNDGIISSDEEVLTITSGLTIATNVHKEGRTEISLADSDSYFILDIKDDSKIKFDANTVDVEVDATINIMDSIEESLPEGQGIIVSIGGDDSIAKMDANGIVTGVAVGQTIVTAKINTKSDEITVNVVAKTE